MLKGIFTAFVTLLFIILILYLAFVCTKYIGRGVNLRNKSRYMKVVDQLVLAQDRQVTIVKIGTVHYLVGVSSSQINLLAKVPEEELIPLPLDSEAAGNVPDFKEILDKLGNKRKRNNNGQ